MVMRLGERDIAQILQLQRACIQNKDIFLPTSREGYLRAFQFANFCFGFRDAPDSALIAFLNCSIPTARAATNLGKGRLPTHALDAVGHMNTLLVHKDCRHHGVGRELVTAALELLIERGCRHIYVTVSPENNASINLLYTFGFAIVDNILLKSEKRHLLYRHIRLA